MPNYLVVYYIRKDYIPICILYGYKHSIACTCAFFVVSSTLWNYLLKEVKKASILQSFHRLDKIVLLRFTLYKGNKAGMEWNGSGVCFL